MAYIGQRPVIGRYIKLDQISSGFNGSNTGFSMTAASQAVFPGTARNLLLSLGGVIQEPDTDFTISGSTLTFTTPPVANTTFFGVIYGDMQATGTPSDGTVLPASIASSGHFKIPQLTVNEDGADVDFRVEGNGQVNLLFVDASTDRIGMGTNSPGALLHLQAATPVIRFTDSDTSRDSQIVGIDGNLRFDADNNDDQSGTNISFKTDNVERLKIDSTELVVNDTGASVDFRVEGDTSTHLLFVDASADKVGIGVSNPANTLEVNGTFQTGVAANTGTYTQAFNITNQVNADFNVHLKTNSTSIGPSTTTPLCFHIGGTANEKMRIHSDGNVGIGTTSPSTALHINMGSGGLPKIRLQHSSAGNDVFEITGGLTGVSNGGFGIYDVDESAYRLAIDSSGDVGIGTTSPQDFLELSNTTAQKKLALSKANSGTADENGMWLRFNNYGPSNTARADGTIIGKIHFYASQPTSGNLQDAGAIECRADGDQTGNNTRSRLSFLTVNSQTATERMQIDKDGTIFSFSPDDTTPNIKWRSDDTNWFGSLNQSVEGATISTFLSTGGDWSANGTTYSATKAIANFETRAIVLHPQFNNGAGKVAFLQKAAGSTTTDGAVTEILSIDNNGIKFGGETAAAHALDDYEEGTHTPTMVNLDVPGHVTVDHFNFTKVGRLVHFNAKFTVSSSINDVSGFGFSLPFTQAGSRENVFTAISDRSGTNTEPFALVLNANQSNAYAKILDGFGSATYNSFGSNVVLVTGTYESN